MAGKLIFDDHQASAAEQLASNATLVKAALGSSSIVFAGLCLAHAWRNGLGKIDPFPGDSLTIFVTIFVVALLSILPATITGLARYIRYAVREKRLTGYVSPDYRFSLPVRAILVSVGIKLVGLGTVALLIVVLAGAFLADLFVSLDTIPQIAFEALIYALVWSFIALMLANIPLNLARRRITRGSTSPSQPLA